MIVSTKTGSAFIGINYIYIKKNHKILKIIQKYKSKIKKIGRYYILLKTNYFIFNYWDIHNEAPFCTISQFKNRKRLLNYLFYEDYEDKRSLCDIAWAIQIFNPKIKNYCSSDDQSVGVTYCEENNRETKEPILGRMQAVSILKYRRVLHLLYPQKDIILCYIFIQQSIRFAKEYGHGQLCIKSKNIELWLNSKDMESINWKLIRILKENEMVTIHFNDKILFINNLNIYLNYCSIIKYYKT